MIGYIIKASKPWRNQENPKLINLIFVGKNGCLDDCLYSSPKIWKSQNAAQKYCNAFKMEYNSHNRHGEENVDFIVYEIDYREQKYFGVKTVDRYLCENIKTLVERKNW